MNILLSIYLLLQAHYGALEMPVQSETLEVDNVIYDQQDETYYIVTKAENKGDKWFLDIKTDKLDMKELAKMKAYYINRDVNINWKENEYSEADIIKWSLECGDMITAEDNTCVSPEYYN